MEIKDWDIFLKAAQQVEKDYLTEVEKNKVLSAELQKAKAEIRQLVAKLQSAQQSSQKLGQLEEEVQKLKANYPIQDLLEAKQVEVERMKKALAAVAIDHPDRKVIESMVKAHIIERDKLKYLAQEAESRFQIQLQQIRDEQPKITKTEPKSPRAKIQVPEY